MSITIHKKLARQPCEAAAGRSPASIEDKPEWALSPPDPAAEVFASWVRVIEGAPVEHRLKLFGMMAADARCYADAVRQQAIDDMVWVAGELGLISLLGAVPVEETLAITFRRSA
jgi:hypothetical protein